MNSNDFYQNMLDDAMENLDATPMRANKNNWKLGHNSPKPVSVYMIERAIAVFNSGESWQTAAHESGVPLARTKGLAISYAEAHGMTLRPSKKKTNIDTATLSYSDKKTLYELRMDGMSWTNLSKKARIPRDSVQPILDAWAKLAGLPKPPNKCYKNLTRGAR